LRTTYGLGQEQINQLLATAAKTLRESIDTARSALDRNDYQTVGETAHSIKGSLLNLGLNDYSNLAKTIEISAKQSRKIDFNALLSKLSKEIGCQLHALN